MKAGAGEIEFLQGNFYSPRMRTPRKIERLGEQGLRIEWEEGLSHEIPSKLLREHCPSAPARAKRGDQSHDKPLMSKPSVLQIVESSIEEEISLQKIWGVGNYALGMEWADGHNTGIYTFDFLYELGEKAKG